MKELSNAIWQVAQNWLPLTLILLAAIIGLSLWPAEQLPPVPGVDKLHHFIAYAALVLPVALKKPKRLWMLVISFLLVSGVIELVQPSVNRHGEWLDMAANAMGLVCGLVIGATLRSGLLPRVENRGCEE